MKYINIDIETYSSVNLAKSGVYRYTESDDFEILLFGCAIDGGAVQVIDLACGEKIPDDVLAALTDPAVLKWAFNAQFERVCLSRYLNLPVGAYLDPSSWRCTMVWAATLGLPLSLEGVGAVLGLEKQKLKEGKDLIRYFCTPARQKDGTLYRRLPQDDPLRWSRFKAYNLRDVETEMGIQKRLSKFPVPESEWQNYRLDQQINDRGVLLDLELVQQAMSCDAAFQETNMKLARTITGLDNPNSAAQMKEWLRQNGVITESLAKDAVVSLLENADGSTRLALQLRQELAKSSVKKYTAMENAVCKDSRARGLIQFYGANRTGRYSGRLIQVQNLPQNHLPDLKQARSLIRQGNFEAAELLYPSVSTMLSELIRTAFVPKPECRFFVADFSAIEARVIAWLAGERWRLKVFADGGDIYCASASQMFGVPVEKHGFNSHLRQKGKIAELALGYGGSVGALKAMGALQMGLSESELKPLVDVWRQANPNIVQLWWDVDRAVKDCVKQKTTTQTHGMRFMYQSGILFIVLPSGRRLAYVKPRLGENKFGGESVTYEGVGAAKKWERLESYGPKFVENIVQATARDILAEAMLRLGWAGYNIVMHVHDEVVIEAPETAPLEEICSIMGQPPAWAKGLLLRADGYVCDFYRKD
ncbi:DNA polymerase [Ructibacterium gallinarum]|uniref:DNA-directed DNA polymerase n=1 Tax=Ructibacterium gallinarum TaxID=2779355 RepID=A0A9D5M5J2_9FIRM|nr:DNA polymerase [Ructibacterium gallinarum]MBE5039842.1 DNA polymerase [Ructibacterium gallinarum]